MRTLPERDLFSPIRFPTLVAVASPNANGSIKNKLVILIAYSMVK